ncbi:MAG: DUF63 family protein [Candidatus Natronoplasma sp.]
MKGELFDYYDNHKSIVWLLIIIVPIGVLILGSLLAREIFWDSFIWRYFWGPVVADAQGDSVDGISAGYNVVNTFTYGIILVISFFGILEIIDHFKVKINRKFVYTLLPWIILGGSLRSLEDVGLFLHPLDKIMITPMIYLLLGFSALFLMLIGAFISSKQHLLERSRLLRAVVLSPLPILYVVLQGYIDPFFPSFLILVLILLIISYLIGIKYLEFNENFLFFSYGMTLIGLSLGYNSYFIMSKEGTNPLEVPIIFVFAITLTLSFLGLSWILDKISLVDVMSGSFEVLNRPLNMLIILAHLFDASSTYRGITVYGYAEKHVLPTFLISSTGPFIVFVVKIILIVLIIYVLDLLFEEEFSETREVSIFLKLVVIILGAAPAIRNTLRIAMGV